MKNEPKPTAAAARYSVAQRIAVTENMALIRLLLDAKTPHAKELAVIVFARIKAIGEGASVLAAPDDEVAQTIELAKQINPELMQ